MPRPRLISLFKFLVIVGVVTFFGYQIVTRIVPMRQGQAALLTHTQETELVHADSHTTSAATLLRHYLTPAELDNFFLHGCWCSKLDNKYDMESTDLGGEPVDALDLICMDWIQEHNCLYRGRGVCLAEHWTEKPAKKQVYKFTATQYWSDNETIAWTDSECSAQFSFDIFSRSYIESNNKCPTIICEINVKYAEMVRGFLNYHMPRDEWQPKFITDGECVTDPGADCDLVHAGNYKIDKTSEDNNPASIRAIYPLYMVKDVELDEQMRVIIQHVVKNYGFQTIPVDKYFPNDTDHRLRNTNPDVMDLLGNYGCWCGAVLGNTHFQGRPLDTIDSLCRGWTECVKCEAFGSCIGEHSEAFVMVYTPGKHEYSCTGITQCSAEHCACNAQFAMGLAQELDKNEAFRSEFVEVLQSDCQHEPESAAVGVGSAEVKGTKDACCGSAPSWVPYSSTSHQCVNDQVVLK